MRITSTILILLFLLVGNPATAEEFTVYIGRVPPFTDVDHQGRAFGAAVDVVAEFMTMTGNPIDVESIRSISWARAVEEVETRPGTMLFGVARTSQREGRFKWVGPVATLNLGLVAKREQQIEIEIPEDLKKYNLGVVRNSAPVQILESRFDIHHHDMTLVKSDELQFRMLEIGRVDMITQADTAAPIWIRKLGMEPDEFEMVYVLRKLDLYVAFNKATDDALIGQAQDALETMKRRPSKGMPRYDSIMKRYMKDGPIPIRKP